ncbi:hypothetical protein Moror_17027 [Moniliophthora roreri MCA 2997]|uniref:Uncharacterized protein n=2 Tax=Moniliophthora roreri TaxID=221103 RepID=V2WRG1_MONRO|nr:hypothetical protein Moror_17027 [Moniliophthora roreri MCA 2997]
MTVAEEKTDTLQSSRSRSSAENALKSSSQAVTLVSLDGILTSTAMSTTGFATTFKLEGVMRFHTKSRSGCLTCRKGVLNAIKRNQSAGSVTGEI